MGKLFVSKSNRKGFPYDTRAEDIGSMEDTILRMDGDPSYERLTDYKWRHVGSGEAVEVVSLEA